MENLKLEVQNLTEWNKHLEARLLIAKTLIPEYVEKFQKFVIIESKMQGYSFEEMKEREDLTKEMFAVLVSKIGLKKVQELYACI